MVRTKELEELRLRNHELTMDMSKVRRELNEYVNKAVREKQRQKDICWVPEATVREVTSELHAEQKMRRRLCGQRYKIHPAKPGPPEGKKEKGRGLKTRA
jgi:hypothetical protein